MRGRRCGIMLYIFHVGFEKFWSSNGGNMVPYTTRIIIRLEVEISTSQNAYPLTQVHSKHVIERES